MERVEALITPSVLRWARESAGFSLDEAAKKLGRAVTDVIAWESGESRPSIPQARKASEVFRRPLAVFYLSRPPEDFDTLRDYRRLPLEQTRAYSTRLISLMRTSQERQNWAKDFLRDEGGERIEFVGSASLGDSPLSAARHLRSALDIDRDEQYKCKTREDTLLLWLRKTERAGVFVFREGGIDLRECRGFAASDDIAPFIYLNSEDARSAQMFTLVHELAHLLINQSGVSNLLEDGRYKSNEASTVESFCNQVASEVLLDRERFEIEWTRLTHLDIEDQIERLSVAFKVSEEVVARRLLDGRRINQGLYRQLREEYQLRWNELKRVKIARMKTQVGGPSFYQTKVANNGYAFTRTVIGAFSGGSLSGREASALLGVKLNYFPKLAAVAAPPPSYRGGAR